MSRELVSQCGFTPKNGTVGVFHKQYNGYTLEVDFTNEKFNYGDLITAESRTTLNFSQPENWVVFECVNRLLDKGYPPQSITLEKTWATGHGTSGRLDILVSKEDGSPFLMIECKTAGAEFEKEFKKTNKDGGQLFTYFQQDRGADFLMLYASSLVGGTIEYRNEIIKIEDEYRETNNVKDLYDIWNKLTKNNGIFESWATPYHFESKALTPEALTEITQEDSSKIFNRFLEILRHNVVSDKPNAFNKIFTLFLCKVYDEKTTRPGEELSFQWFDGGAKADNHVRFQKRLTDLYAKGMKEFLDKKVTDFSEESFDNKFGNALSDTIKQELLEEITRIRLEKNNEFAIKEVFDRDSFEDNAKVVKEVVELLQGYKIRYTKKQQYLSDFFELLLTTGLKQESGQFFTPVPIAQFIIRSLPVDSIIETKLTAGERDNLLPTIIDYAAGSGHFLTESMHLIQSIVNSKNPADFLPDTAKKIKAWKEDHFDWADQYVYGVEKDYRLVKVGKVGCYLHGDGIANVVHSDGLGNFARTKEYTGKLKQVDSDNPQDNRQFDVVVSNPPYSVSAFRNNARKYYDEKDFELYDALTDQSSEIECLFVERTKQLLKDGGVAGVILPSSILSNGGIYTKTREIVLRYFDIVAIAELGSNTFMATGTNTVTLFLRRRKNQFAKDIERSVDRIFSTVQDCTVAGIETPTAKYATSVWGCSFDDYATLIRKAPNPTIRDHELFKDYCKKIGGDDEMVQLTEILKREQEKLVYFILTLKQQVVLVNSGEKQVEKSFLGYEFSNRRGSEGIHPIQRGKSIDECTSLYDPTGFENPEKASTYIYDAFAGKYDRPIVETLANHLRRVDLVDMLTFDRPEFDKSISLAVKKKVKIESQWPVVKLQDILTIVRGGSPRPIREYLTTSADGVNWIKIGDISPESKYIEKTGEKITQDGVSKSRLVEVGDFILSNSMSFGRPYIMKTTGCIHDGWLLLTDFNDRINKDFLYNVLSDDLVQKQFKMLAGAGTTVSNLNIDRVKTVNIPLPPLDVQQTIVDEIAVLEDQEKQAKEEIALVKNEINAVVSSFEDMKPISEICTIASGRTNPQNDQPDELVSFVGLENIESNTGKLVNFSPSRAGNIQSTKSLFGKGDVLYGKLRPYLNKVWIAEFEGVCSTDILVLETEHPVILKQILLSDAFVSRSSDLMKGVSLPRLQVKDFLAFKVPYPAVNQERKIVAKIESLESEIARLESLLGAIPAQKEAVLKRYL